MTTEKEEFALSGSPGCSHEDDKMETSISIGDPHQVGLEANMTFKANKEVQTCPEQIKMLRTIGTQTVVVLAPQKPNTTHPDDINKLSHLEDHSYSFGPKTESSADHNLEIVKPCTPEFKEQSMFPDCGGILDELINMESEDEADNDQDDNSPLYCPSASDDDSETDNECSTITPSAEKKLLCLKVIYYSYLSSVKLVVAPLMQQHKIIREVW